MYRTILVPMDGSKRAEAILNTAAETGTDLIAMATHGLSGLARVSYGSVAAGVLQAADIPILLIRSRNDKKEETC